MITTRIRMVGLTKHHSYLCVACTHTPHTHTVDYSCNSLSLFHAFSAVNPTRTQLDT